MHDLAILRDLVIIVALAIPVVAATQKLHVSPLVGFLLTGIIIGPHGLGLIGRADEVRGLAELGVLLLLFTIGLELSLSRIFRMGRVVLQGGALQVTATILVVAGLVALVGNVALPKAVFFGCLIALSSTAIVLRAFVDRGEVDTPHGRVVVAILLFQDLCIVPMMLIAPILAGTEASLAIALRKMLVNLAVLGVLVLGGRLAIPWILERIANLRNREIFTLSILLFGLGAAYVTSTFGLSLALGAFLAGLIISESEYGIQALSDVLPFRATFSGIFFISVGMLLNLGYLVDNLALVTGATLAILLVKALIAAGSTRLLKRSVQVSVQSGLALAQVGEFSFVLALVGLPLGLLGADAYQMFLSTSVVTMLAAPFLITASPAMARAACRWLREPAIEIHPHEEAAVGKLLDHVIIVGYGMNGRNLARVLKAAAIPYIILEQNGQVLRRARLEREPIYFGDGTRQEVLERVGIKRARVIVFAISAPAEERRGVATARRLSPDVRIVIRTRYVASTEDLRHAGANEVVPEEFETSIEIFARVLRMYGVPGNVIEREVAGVRGESYEALRGMALPDLRLDALRHLGVHNALETLQIEEGASAIGENPTTLELRRITGATVIAVVREGEALYTPDPEFRFHSGDTVVIFGDGEALLKAGGIFRATDARTA